MPLHPIPDPWQARLEKSARDRSTLGRARSIQPARGIDFCSNDYLGLRRDPRLAEAAAMAARDFGTGTGAARLLRGTTPLHEELEAAIAQWKGSESCLLFNTGYQCNATVIPALLQPGDAVFSDALNHASLVDGCRAAKARGAHLGVFKHRNLHDLETQIIAWKTGMNTETETSRPGLDRTRSGGQRGDVASEASRRSPLSSIDRPGLDRTRSGGQRGDVANEVSRRSPLSSIDRPGLILVITDAIFSMDGDAADLPALLNLCERHQALLMVDEAHASGLLGPTGAGLAELQGVKGRIPLLMGTLGKALGSFGAFLACDPMMRDHLVNTCRGFIFSTALPPPCLGAALEALRINQTEPWRREKALSLAARLRDALELPAQPSAIVPVWVGTDSAAVQRAMEIQARGFDVRAVRPPTVPEGSARLRITTGAHLMESQIDALIKALRGAVATP